MSSRERREDSFASPARARSLFTIRAAISSALSSDDPRSSKLSLMCSYCRSRLALQASGIAPPRSRFRRDRPTRVDAGLFERKVLDVVLGGVLVDELVDHGRALAVGVVDLDEGIPLVGQRI